MPLVFAFLIVAALLLSYFEGKNKAAKNGAISAKSMRKTNARLEQRILDQHMKCGKSFDESFALTQQEIVSRGFEPCIPRSGYKGHKRDSSDKYINHGDYNTSHCPKLEDYDSYEVQARWEELYEDWKRKHPNENGGDEFAPSDEEIYKDFPTTQWEYELGIDQRRLRMKLVPIGEYIILPNHGTCEVVGYNFNSRKTGGSYSLKVLHTGQIIDYISFHNSQIKKPGGK